jgi:hypothetical protein
MTCKDINSKIFNSGVPELQPPKNQTAEVLYELINNKHINRRDILIETGILNITARLSDIRKHGIVVECKMIEALNKHNRKVQFGQWSVSDKNKAIEIYNKINN